VAYSLVSMFWVFDFPTLYTSCILFPPVSVLVGSSYDASTCMPHVFTIYYKCLIIIG
jgi:hypothetical protein